MTIADIEKTLHKYDKHLETVEEISVEKESGQPLCEIKDITYSYDKIVADLFTKKEERPRSVDAISIKNGFVKFVEKK